MVYQIQSAGGRNSEHVWEPNLVFLSFISLLCFLLYCFCLNFIAQSLFWKPQSYILTPLQTPKSKVPSIIHSFSRLPWLFLFDLVQEITLYHILQLPGNTDHDRTQSWSKGILCVPSHGVQLIYKIISQARLRRNNLKHLLELQKKRANIF